MPAPLTLLLAVKVKVPLMLSFAPLLTLKLPDSLPPPANASVPVWTFTCPLLLNSASMVVVPVVSDFVNVPALLNTSGAVLFEPYPS